MLRNRKTEKLCIGFTIVKLFLVLTDMLPITAALETPEGDHIGSVTPCSAGIPIHLQVDTRHNKGFRNLAFFCCPFY